MVGGMLILPETPRFLIKKGRQDKAAKALSRLRRLDVDHPALIEELAEITANHEYEMSIGTASYLGCFKAPIRKRLFTGMALQALQQLTGVNFIFYYGTSYVSKRSSLHHCNSLIPRIVPILGHQQSVHHLRHYRCCQRMQHHPWPNLSREMGSTSTIDVRRHRHGCMSTHRRLRRNSLTQQPYLQPSSHCLREWKPLAHDLELYANLSQVCIYIFFFACSWGPCAWVVTGEIFPLKARARGLSMTTASNWLLNWAIAYATPYMVT